MEEGRGSNGSEETNLLRVAIMVDGASHLHKMDVSYPMEDIVKQLCDEYGVVYEKNGLALWTMHQYVEEGTRCISDKNKHKVPPGSILILKESPVKITEMLMQNLAKNGLIALGQLAVESEDTTVLGVLHAFDAHEYVFKILSENQEASAWVPGLIFVHRLYMKRLIRRVPMKILSWLFVSLSYAYEAPKDLILQCILLLSAVRRFGRLRYQEQLFDHLAALLFLRDQPEVQEASLELLNYLVLFPNNAEEETVAVRRVVNQKIVGCICDNILRGTPSKGMLQQLYRYQTLVLRHYWHKKVTKVLGNDPVMEALRNLTHRVKRGDISTLNRRRRVFSEGSDLPSTPTPISSKNGMIANIKSSFRWTRSTSRTPPVLPESPPALSLTMEEKTPTTRVERAQPPKNLRMGSRFYSCIAKSDGDMETTTDIHFNFHGPIFYVPPPRNENRAHVKKAASTSDLTLFIDDTDTNVDGKLIQDRALSSKAVSELTVENLKYQAEHYPAQYRKWAVAKEQNYGFAEQITHLVSRLLEVGRPRPIDSPGDGFHPLVLFVFPYVLEELYCEAFVLYEKTSREVKARGDHDVPKVMAIVQEHLSCALNPKQIYFSRDYHFKKWDKPTSMDNLKYISSKITCQQVAEKRRREREELLKHDLNHKPLFLEYREKCKPAILKLIEQQRWAFLLEGQHLLKVNAKGDIQKYLREFLGLNKKRDQLMVGECQIEPKRCDHTRTLPVENIVHVSFGKQSKFYKDVFNQNEHWLIKAPEEPEHWKHLFSLKMKDNIYHNFCARDLKSMHYLADSFSILLGQAMSSPTMEKELQDFLDMEVRLHFLDVEGLPLPDNPPQVPPPPPNYDFLAREKRKKTNIATIKTAQ